MSPSSSSSSSSPSSSSPSSWTVWDSPDSLFWDELPSSAPPASSSLVAAVSMSGADGFAGDTTRGSATATTAIFLGPPCRSSQTSATCSGRRSLTAVG
eukprot:CAMPEP_0183302008 /NCGR_PEP_ID=MMETSP0160_2-20130417/7949_2 /TAXON_ID=2839 ORGANISM="Odontella Sinensis, Strain Grunow 1884" /NCGR_SAMPLE_ID=MMETSP0160_2 /ASSEMBLY_ACC=CAM_ASM_000250 /LENGTH=97 /DNA_ID=CAMNT_0025464729 /DNA_START=384 /DNA_END=674 /DNA_ORIENTATION=-